MLWLLPRMLSGPDHHGIRLLDAPGIGPVRWERILDPDSGAQVLDLRYRPL